jgi:hypothetical protein
LGDSFGYIKAAVRGKAGKGRPGKADGGGFKAGAAVLHIGTGYTKGRILKTAPKWVIVKI